MRLDMRTRKKITSKMAERYRKASKAEKGKMLNELCALAGYNRSYAARVLREASSTSSVSRKAEKRPPGARGQGRKPLYTAEVTEPLKKVWAIMNFPCGKRLVAALPEMIRVLELFGEIELAPQAREGLLKISSATADRLLAPERKKLTLKARCKTKPGSLLKHQVPIRTYAEWNDLRPGFLEVDLVGHEGGNPRGDFCQSLVAVDVSTGWTELRAVKNKAQVWVFEAIADIRKSLPFPLLGIDSDSGAEFTGAHLIRYCQQEGITFTRGRPSRKNDNCYVEQKNYTAVRQYVGYMRHDTEAELKTINELYSYLCPYLNFFQPQAKLIYKERIGSKVKKRYDNPKTPYQRIISSPDVSDQVKKKLKRRYDKLNPAELRRKILELQDRLYQQAVFKGKEMEMEAEQADKDYEYIYL